MKGIKTVPAEGLVEDIERREMSFSRGAKR